MHGKKNFVWIILVFLKIVVGQSQEEFQIQNISPSMPTISSLDVRCDQEYMRIAVTFDQQYRGIVYSKGHYNDPNCGYVEAGSVNNFYEFYVPLNGCGTVFNEIDESPRFQNILIFQMDPLVQEIWDQAKLVSCSYDTNYRKQVSFQAINVGMLDVMSVPFEGFKVDCWMGIQRGTFPSSIPIEGITEIGEEMSLLVYFNDYGRGYDVKILDCFAYDSETPDSISLQLSGTDGCPLRPKLMGHWQRTLDTGSSGATIIAFNRLNAFKFPDRMQVLITCNVEVCTDSCDSRCPGEPTEPISVRLLNEPIGSTTTRTPSTKTTDVPATETVPTTESTSTRTTVPTTTEGTMKSRTFSTTTMASTETFPTDGTTKLTTESTGPTRFTDSTQGSVPTAFMQSTQRSVLTRFTQSTQKSVPTRFTQSTQRSVPTRFTQSTQRSVPTGFTQTTQWSVPRRFAQSTQISVPTGFMQRSSPTSSSVHTYPPMQYSSPYANEPSNGNSFYHTFQRNRFSNGYRHKRSANGEKKTIISISRGVSVIAKDDLPEFIADSEASANRNHLANPEVLCLPVVGLTFGALVLLSIAIMATLFAVIMWFRLKKVPQQKSF